MAKEVESQFTSSQLEDYGNIINNGYLSVEANTNNVKAWQYAETGTAPVDLPSVTQVRPAFKGWTTNYMDYYTQLQPNGYGVNPGDPTMFEFNVHSFTKYFGPIVSATYVSYGNSYTPGSYVGIATTTNGNGFNATVDFEVDAFGRPYGFAVNGAGSDYSVGDTVEPINVGQGGSEPIIFHVTEVTIAGGGDPKYAQRPVRRAGAIVPQADNIAPPPIDNLGL